jgi:hypothetical protein
MNKPNSKSKGGKRNGAGRPFNTGKYKEPTTLVRIPKSLSVKVDEILGEFLENVNGEKTEKGANDERDKV